MPRKRIGKEPLTSAEKQRRYRERQKAQGKKRTWTDTAEITAPDMAALREQIIKELKKSWEPELKAERAAAERKKGRELAKKADQNYGRGRVEALCDVAAYFIGKDRHDLAQFVLTHFMIDREKAAAVLEADKRTKSMTLSYLDNAGAWKPPPMILR